MGYGRRVQDIANGAEPHDEDARAMRKFLFVHEKSLFCSLRKKYDKINEYILFYLIYLSIGKSRGKGSEEICFAQTADIRY